MPTCPRCGSELRELTQCTSCAWHGVERLLALEHALAKVEPVKTLDSRVAQLEQILAKVEPVKTLASEPGVNAGNTPAHPGFQFGSGGTLTHAGA